MSLARAWLTPEDAPEPYTCKALRFPNSTAWQAIVEGALLNLAEPENWEKEGALTPEEAAQVGLKIYAQFACSMGGYCVIPVGSIVAFGGDDPPEGWMLCVGSTLSKTEYPELFGVLGYRYGGSGDNFNLPDLFDRYVKGTTGQDPGAVVGAHDRTLTVAEMPAHTHSCAMPTGGTFYGPGVLFAMYGVTYPQTGSAGGGQAFDNRPESLALYYIIRVK